MNAKVTSFQICPKPLHKQFKFEGKISMHINCLKFLMKILKFKGKNDNEVQDHEFLNSSATLLIQIQFSFKGKIPNGYHLHKESY